MITRLLAAVVKAELKAFWREVSTHLARQVSVFPFWRSRLWATAEQSAFEAGRQSRFWSDFHRNLPAGALCLRRGSASGFLRNVRGKQGKPTGVARALEQDLRKRAVLQLTAH